jgi:hypothetical protein
VVVIFVSRSNNIRSSHRGSNSSSSINSNIGIKYIVTTTTIITASSITAIKNSSCTITSSKENSSAVVLEQLSVVL